MDLKLFIIPVIVFIVAGYLSYRHSKNSTSSWMSATKSWDHVFPSQEHDKPKKEN